MVPALFGPWASRLIQAASPRPGERVLDVACGTGVVARQVATHVHPEGKVVGLDLNPNMLAVARTMAEQEGLAIDWHEGRAESLPYPDGSFELVLCQFVFMFFSDRRSAIAEMHRVLSQGGHMSLSVWQGLNRHPFYQALHDVIERRLGMSGIQDIFSLGGAKGLRALLAEAGFQQVEIEPVSMTARFPNPEGFLAGEIDVDTAAIPAMQHLDARARQEMTAAIREDMEPALHGLTKDDQVVIPFHANLVHAGRRLR